MLKIGNLQIEPAVVMAPMAGITDLAFRLLVRKFGARLTFVEMINCRSLSHKSKKTREMLRGDLHDQPLGAQLLGSDLKYILPALEVMLKFPIDIIDFNAACPMKKVTKRGEGVALMKTPRKLQKILKAMVSNSRLPVTLKIRTGWDKDSVNAKEVALYAQDAGISAIFIHGRTQEQKYYGAVDYQAIAGVKKAVQIPVVASGNLWSAVHAQEMLDKTGCDGVAVARGALGNPWIFREISALLKDKPIPPRPDLKEIAKIFFEHLDSEIALHGERRAVLLFRKFPGWYFKGVPHICQVREKVSHAKTRSEITDILRQAQIA